MKYRRRGWEICGHQIGSKILKQKLDAGWEPYAVTGKTVHLRRQK